MRGQISENLDVVHGFIAQNITTEKNSAWVDVTDCREVAALVTSGDDAAGQTLSVQFQVAKDASGTGAVDLGDPVTVTAATSGKVSAMADKAIAGLSEDFTHLRAQVTNTGSPANITSATCLVIKGELRFAP